MDTQFSQKIRSALSRPLPGLPVQQLMAPEGRPIGDTTAYRRAAVMIALFSEQDRWYFPLIRRVADSYEHSGQIGFPGGRMERGEIPAVAAARETYEEIGIPTDQIHILGPLTPLPIPVSRHLVHPVVGLFDKTFDWKLNVAEVQSIITVPLDDLVDPQVVQTETWYFGARPRQVPYFYLQTHKVWGATAMILSEFKHIIELLYRREP